jgi:hypothetical protein
MSKIKVWEKYKKTNGNENGKERRVSNTSLGLLHQNLEMVRN